MSAIEHASAGSIRVEAQESRTVIVFVGEVDAALRQEASASMAAALVSGLPVVVDSAALTFIDSSGLAFVLQLHLACSEAGIPLTLRDPHRVLRDVLDMVGLGASLAEEPADGPLDLGLVADVPVG
jgi:anti-anti-sigma factor